MQKLAFTYGWTPILHKDTTLPNGFFSMREWQEECFVAFDGAHHWIINAPTASGKSFLISALLADRLSEDGTLRAIVAVPQTIIASGFRYNMIEFPDGSRDEFVPQHDLCSDNPDSNIDRIRGFLEGPNDRSSVNDRILLCSHASLVRAFEVDPDAFRDVILVVDEAHHAQNAEMEEIEDITISNSLGGVVLHSLKNPKKNIQVGLSTATFFRGDRLSIIPKDHEEDFTRYDLPYDAFLRTCEHLRGFRYDFDFHLGEYPETLQGAFSEGVGKTIVYIPSVNGRYSIGSKQDDADEVLRAIAKSDHPEIRDEGLPVMRVRRGRKWIRVINLVDEDLREEKKRAIIADHEASESHIDVIIALNMFKEGASWKWADRSIIIGAKNSLNEVIQIIGRLLRDCPGKEFISVLQLLPAGLDTLDEEEVRENLNAYMKAIFLSMMLEDILHPVKIKQRKEQKESEDEDKDDNDDEALIDPLREVFSTEAEILSFHEEVRDRMIEAVDVDPSLKNDKRVLFGRFIEVVVDILTEDDIEEYHEEIAERVWMQWSRRSQRMSGIDVDDVDFDILTNDPLGFLLAYTSGVCGVETFRGLRQALQSRYFLPFEEAREFAQKLELKSMSEWQAYSRSDNRPNDIPSAPNEVYADEGWVNWGDWLGTGTVAPQNRSFLPFEEARAFVHELGLKNQKEWRYYSKYGNRPDNIPSAPWDVYADEGWVGMGDWLGTGTVASFNRLYLSFDDARAFVWKLGLKSGREWSVYCKSENKPDNIPACPDQVYADEGWAGMGDWLGTGAIAPKNCSFCPFKEARAFAQKLGLKSWNEWRAYCRSGGRPEDIPSNPGSVYADEGWVNWGDWLGTGTVAPQDRSFRPFEEARDFARRLGLKSFGEWRAYCKSGDKPEDIPAAPEWTYRDDGWAGVGDWLGTGVIATQNRLYLPFEEARAFVRKLGLKRKKEWRSYYKSGNKPDNIPAGPVRVYADEGWAGWRDWLGTE